MKFLLPDCSKEVILFMVNKLGVASAVLKQCLCPFSKHRPSGPMLSISRNVRLSVCSLFEVPFKHLFAPTSRSWLSKFFRDLESLGKSNGKKWSQI